ncbi:MAG: M14 family zinc carboxypeptidase [Pseudobdellovibrionaceae bacterium]
MAHFIFGDTPLGLPIPAYKFGGIGPEVLILGGVHGDEIEGIVTSHGLLREFTKSFPYRLSLTLIPALNVEGMLYRTRSNSRGVDLNRNLPTKDWTAQVLNPRYNPGPSAGSEPENQALMRYLSAQNPKFILSLHSWHPMLNINGNCKTQAEAIHALTGYRIDESIGYPTPGCLGTYSGIERGLPTLTYEIERGQAPEKVLQMHLPAIQECLKVCEKILA